MEKPIMENNKYVLISEITNAILKSSDKLEDLLEAAKPLMKKGQSLLIKESNSGEIIKECRLLLD